MSTARTKGRFRPPTSSPTVAATEGDVLKRTQIKAMLDRLTVEDMSRLVTSYRNYMVIVGGVDRRMFGDNFDAVLRTAVRTGDKTSALRSGARDVIASAFAPELEHEAALLRDHLETEVGPELWSKLAVGSANPNSN